MLLGTRTNNLVKQWNNEIVNDIMFIFKGVGRNNRFSKHYSIVFEGLPSLFLCLFSYIAKPLLICIECRLSHNIKFIMFICIYSDKSRFYTLHVMCLKLKDKLHCSWKISPFCSKAEQPFNLFNIWYLRRIVITYRIIRGPDIFITSLEKQHLL